MTPQHDTRLTIVRDYFVALGAVFAALLVRWALRDVLGQGVPYLTLFGAVGFAVWFARWRPALVAAVLGFVAANYFLVDPTYEIVFNARTGVEFAGYLASTGLIIFFGETLHRTRDLAAREMRARSLLLESERQQKELLHVTLASIGDAVIVCDPRGHVISMNPEAERLTGWTQFESIGKRLSEVFRIVNDETGEPVEDLVEQVLRESTIAGPSDRTVLVSKNGERAPIHDCAAPIREPDGPLLGVVLVFRNITAERIARRAEAQLAAIVQYSGDAIATKNLDGIVQTWNASAEKLFGYSADEIIGKPITVLLPPDRLQEETDILNRLRQGTPVERFETIRVTKDGRLIPVAVRVSPIRDSEGRVIGASKIVHDIAEMVGARDALAEEHELVETTLASIGDAVITTDAAALITYLNPVAERVTGWSRADAIGKPLERVFHVMNESTRRPIENPALRALREGTIVGVEAPAILLRSDGSERVVDDSAAPIRGREGKVVGCVLVFRDVSDRRREARRAEEEIERLLANERKARVEVERINRMKDEFLATLSHELRTPLNAILGFGQLIQKSPGDLKVVTEGIQVITRNARLQADLIADLLDMSRIISGKIRLDIADVNLKEITMAGIDAIRHSAAARGIFIDTDLPREPVRARGDSGRLQQVVWNLLSNAVKFTPRHGRINVALETDGANARILVRDTGTGIRAEMLPHLFERFRQADSSAAREHGGLGIGLAIVKHLVELHGGSVYAASEGEGKGSLFTVELPLIGMPLAAAARESERPVSVTADPIDDLDDVDLDGLEVLAIDDQEDSLIYLTRVLEEHGARVIHASSADEGLWALGKYRPQIVLCDIGMPQVDGYQFIRRMRESGDHTPALAVTAFAHAEDRLRALRAGYQGHITKPLNPAELLATIMVFTGQQS